MNSQKKFSEQFLYSLIENNYLNFRGLDLTNEELEECLNTFEPLFEKIFIKHIKLSGNKLNHYKISDILKIFPRTQNIYISDVAAIDNNITSSQINIIIN